MRYPQRLVVVIFGWMLLLVSWAPPVQADVNDFIITKFDADYTLTKVDPQGELKVVEKIYVDFHDYNHGLLRAIPNTYKKHRLQLEVNKVSSESGAAAQYTTYQSNGNTVLQIGDPNNVVTGPQEYTISYTLSNVISFYDDHDELYWDVNGDQWSQSAEKVMVSLHLPPGLKLSRTPICYTGTYGSTAQDCARGESFAPDNQNIRFTTTKPLQAYETLSIVAGFNKGYFRPSAWYETVGEYAMAVFASALPALLIGGTAGWHWFRYGRDPKGRGTVVPEYEPPDGLKPIEAGTIADFKTDNRDITATIIDLAIRGYIKIIETTKERSLRRDLKTYSLRLEKDDYSQLAVFERDVLDAILPGRKVGSEVDLSTLKYKMAGSATSLRALLRKDLTDRDYFRKTPLSTTLRFFVKLAVAFVVSLVLSLFLDGPLEGLGVAVGILLAFVFIVLMPSRTPKGVAAKESIMGLKLYLKTAEKDRLKMLQSPDAPYMPKSVEPQRTVELFEKLLPYAIVLEVEEQWAKQFKDLYQTPPDWYQGHWTGFSSIYLVAALSSGIGSSVNSAFSSPSSSSSSGFGGGGSGGGGGGGGGGGW